MFGRSLVSFQFSRRPFVLVLHLLSSTLIVCVVILQPCVDVLSLINKPVKMREKKETQSIQKQKQKQKQKHAHPSEAITGSLMISCEIGQMNSGG